MADYGNYDGYGGYEPSYANASPRTFGEVPGLWMKIFGMTTDFFAREAPRASVGTTIIGVLIATVIGTIFSVISSLVTLVVYGEQSMEFGFGYIIGVGCGSFLISLLGFYLSNGIEYLLARLFGGTGSFGTQTYLASLVVVPLTVATGILGLLGAIPCVNIGAGLVAFGLSIYGIVLYVRLISATHHLSTGKSVAVVLIPIVLSLLLVCCLTAAGLALLGPMIEEIFEDIMWELGMYLVR